MREIKFRAWDEKKKFMLRPGRFIIDQYSERLEGLIENNDETDGAYRNLILMQYTGLKDKSNREIYEGDIVKSQRFKWTNKIIVFKDGAFRVCNSRGSNSKPLNILNNHYRHVDVIGNIYENPELLEQP